MAEAVSERERTDPGSEAAVEASEGSEAAAPKEAEERPAPFLDPAAAFRETFLCHFTRRGDARVIRRMGEFLYDAVVETPYQRNSGPPYSFEPRVRARAALADLRYLALHLKDVASSAEFMGVARRERRLVAGAVKVGEKLEQLADELEQALWRGGPRRGASRPSPVVGAELGPRDA
jgi:hypothetical protein